jgi:predicted transcriptional regulator
MAKRGKLEIIKDILTIIKENKNKIKPTPLLRKTNISSTNFKQYFNDLKKRNLIIEKTNKNGKIISLTQKGETFLQKYQTIINFIEEFEI